MSADWKGLGFNPNLTKSDSLLAQNRVRKDALTADAELVDTGFLTEDLIVNNAVTTDKIKDGAVTTPKIADNAVTTGKIAPGAVGQADIASNVVQGTHITGDSITGTHIINGGIGQNDIASNVIQGTHVTGSAILGTHIGTNTIAAASIQDNSITAQQIGTFNFAEGTGNITAGTINSTLAYQANGTAGISTIATILDRDVGIGTTTHTLTFTNGLLTNYGTA